MVGSNIREHPRALEWEFLTPTSQELDLTCLAAVRKYTLENRPDIVIHGAGRVGGIQANISSPVEFMVANLDIGRNVIMASAEAGVPKLLNLGSSCMYPCNAPNPLHEEMILQGELEPTNEGYALAKIVAARLCQYLRRERGLAYKTLIPCNLYGRHDKFSPENSHLIPAIIHKVHTSKATGDSTVEIWGDGSARREFMYAGDFADAVMYALDHFDETPDLLNIGLGHDHSINEYYEVVASIVGWQGRFVHDVTKPVGMRQKLVAIDRQLTWGWKPMSSLQDGIRDTYEYYLAEICN